MSPTFHSLWTQLNGAEKSALSACLGISKSYLSQVAHGRCPSAHMARSIALCVFDERCETVSRVDGTVRELFPLLDLPNYPARRVAGHLPPPDPRPPS